MTSWPSGYPQFFIYLFIPCLLSVVAYTLCHKLHMLCCNSKLCPFSGNWPQHELLAWAGATAIRSFPYVFVDDDDLTAIVNDACNCYEWVHCTTRPEIGFQVGQTVASAHALHQPTSCGSEYFYNQRPRVWNLIGIEHSLNRSEHRVKKEAS